MIIDRTHNDVLKSIELAQRGGVFSEKEIETLERGMVTINTLNRIEEKQKEIANLISEMGYSVSIENKTWKQQDVFFFEDLKRIVSNVEKLRTSFFALNETPANPRAEYHYREFNLIEKVLLDIQNNAVFAEENYKICGSAECGG